MNTTNEILKLCWQTAWKYPRYLVGVLIMVPIANLSLRLIPPLIVASIINKLSKGEFTQKQPWETFGNDILLFALISFAGGVIAWRIVIYLIWKLEGYVQRDLYRKMFNKFMELGADFHSNSFGGSLVSQTSKLVGAYVRLQDTFVFQIYTLLIAFGFITVVLYPKAPEFILAMWSFSAVFIFMALILSKPVRKLTAIEAASQNKVTGFLADSITNVMAVKSFSGNKKEQQRFNEATEGVRQTTMNVMWATIWRDLGASIITTALSIAAVVVAVYAVVNNNAELGTVFLLMAYTADIAERLWQLSSTTLRQYNRAIGDAYQGVITLNTKPTVNDPESPERLKISSGKIKFGNVTFDHDSNEENGLFHNLNLVIEPGQKVGLVGHSGGGKTTITKLILRYMDVARGAIFIDDQNIAKLAQDDLRSVIAYVPQEPLLFHRSLSENIAYGKDNASQQEIENAAKMANAHEFIETLPKGYETLVGERGVKLSGGQRQRVAIARAMLKNAPILVLDEATSALDSDSEKLIQDALWKLMENKTAIVIAHRLSTVQKMDRILVLEDGQLIEDGSHAELLKSNGIYSELWKHQSGGFLED